MRDRMDGCRIGRRCPCGALARDGTDACEKCTSRVRWTRRKARRTFEYG